MEDMVMVTMDTMVRGQLRQSQDMATTVMDMDMVMAMEDMVMVTMDTMVRGQLRQSQDMDIMVMAMDMGMAMDMVMDIMDTTARDLLMLKLSQLPLLNQVME